MQENRDQPGGKENAGSVGTTHYVETVAVPGGIFPVHLQILVECVE